MASVNYAVPKIGQGNARCCWLACYQMLYAWKGRSRTEPHERARRSGVSTTSGLYEDQWGKARDAMWLTSYRVGHLKESADNLYEVLRKHGPMWCAGNFLQGSGHAIVVCSIDTESGAIRANDPYEIYNHPDADMRLTFSGWRKLVREMPFACQVWP